MDRTIFSVGQINRYIKNVFENDFMLRGLFVKGEISNFKRHSTGNCYFSLKDSLGVISCILFRRDAEIIPFEIENGMDVILYGNISVYEKVGQYQVYAEFVEPVGVGALQLAFEQLKNKLEDEGLFDPDFKREIPENIKNIAVITSQTGAVIRDIINVVKRRNPQVNIHIFPALVQGDGSKNSIVNAIELVNSWGKCEILILARGGGSMEDLWSFNEEEVARAIFASEIPVVSAVGHETDFTISDFVADVRASTPSVAGELVTEPIMQKFDLIESLEFELNRSFNEIYKENCQQLLYLEERINYFSPEKKLEFEKEKLSNIENRFQFIIENKLKNNWEKLQFLDARLSALSPLQVMKRGYAIISDENKNKITSISQIEVNQTLDLQLEDGLLKVKVTNID